jgi:hypothetical protein
MLFFRSEDMVKEWCRARGVEPRPIVSMAQLWGLAIAWYSSRLEATARRPGPAEMRAIFAGLGLTGSFWDPQADTFGAQAQP